MPPTKFPYGVDTPFITGGAARFSNPWATVRFVDYDNGSDNNKGTEPGQAFKTIQAAVTASSAQDVIYIRPRAYQLGQGFRRYEEDVVITQGGTAGSGNVATNANMSLIGVTSRVAGATDFLGVRWKYATNTNLNIEAPGTHLENIGFFAEDSTYAIYIETDGATRSKGGTDGSSIYNCAIKGDPGIYANGGNEIQIVGCRFQAKYDGTTAKIHLVGSANAVARPIIKNCEFIGGNANEAKTEFITTAAPVYDLMIRDCYFSAKPDSNIYLNIAGTSSTGVVANCYFGDSDINAACTGLVAGVSGAFASALYDQTGIDDFSS